MTTKQLARLPEFEELVAGEEREVRSVYCADLLSWAMGRAPEGGVWCTVMGNVNVIAVAALAEVAAVVVCEGAELDEGARARAAQQGICVLRCALPVFEAGLAAAKVAGLHGLQ